MRIDCEVMLSFDIRLLESTAVHVDDDLPADDPIWNDEDLRPHDAVHVTGRLSTAGEGRFYFSGQLQGSFSSTCRRCLTPVTAAVNEETHLIFADGHDAEDDDDSNDPDVYVLDPRAPLLDLRPAVREQWILGAPAWHLCRDDCQGICPTCGADRNIPGACNCAPATDPRWDALGTAHPDARKS